MRKFTFLLILIVNAFFTSTIAQVVCPTNSDFELGNYTGWSYYIGSCCPSGAIYTSSVATTPGTSFALTSGTGTDPYGGFPVVGEGLYSLKIGSTVTNCHAQRATYYVHVPTSTSNYSLVYRYAFVMQDPGHPATEQPRMTIQATDSSTGALVPSANFNFVAGSLPGAIGPVSGNVYYRPWTTGVINLSGYGGSIVKVTFATGDCQTTGHWGYGYVDMSCGLFAISTVASCSSTTVQLTAPSGFSTYVWYDFSTFSTLYGTTQAISIPTPATNTTYAVIMTPAPGLGVPDTMYTTVNHIICSGTPTPGTVSASALSSCGTSPFILTNTGYSGATNFQWQSSPDSLTWSNIIGATTNTYTSSGVSVTTYFRCKDSCCLSGLSAVTPGIKITYAACCSGTPIAGTAITSTTYCSSCSLTLNLTGFTNAPGITFQWQSSPDSVTWSNISGAITVPYSVTPTGATYYRCVVACTFSGLYAYSTGVRVLYQYLIIADTTNADTSPTCPGPGPQFYVKVNGTSSLLALKTYYGDGTKDSLPLVQSTNYSYLAHTHSYAVTGTYTIKQVVYWHNIPQDSISFNYIFNHCNGLRIYNYYDLNNNCIKDPGELAFTVPIPMEVDSNGTAVDTFTITSGIYYKAYGPIGTIYSFKVISPYIHVSCPLSGTLSDTIVAGAGFYPIKYFALQGTAGSDFDIAENIVMVGTGVHAQVGNLYVRNNLFTPINAITTLTFDPIYQVADISPAPISQSGNTITWDTILSATGSIVQYYYHLEIIGSTLPLGDTVHSNSSIIPITGDIDTTNNVSVRCDTVKSGFDPNHIEVSPAGCFINDTQIQYTISFENTGNDTAYNIHVMDTLSANVDMNSLKLIMASAEMNIALYNDGGYNIVKFDFPAINLLDSSHHGQCDGAVIFTVNTKPGLADGGTIFNRAGIYFDDNDGVMTNTVENIKGCVVSRVPVVSANKIEIYPNPTTDELTIKMDAGAYNSCVITNNVGQVVIEQQLNTPLTKVNVKMLPSGMYYITVKGEGSAGLALTRKFVKM